MSIQNKNKRINRIAFLGIDQDEGVGDIKYTRHS